jgi:hypothetical protein
MIADLGASQKNQPSDPVNAKIGFPGFVSVLYGGRYLGPYFTRITMLLFPGFCVLIGTAFADLQLRLRNHRAAAVVLNPQQPDVRQLVRQDLEKLIGKAPATIGVLRFGPYF